MTITTIDFEPSRLRLNVSRSGFWATQTAMFLLQRRPVVYKYKIGSTYAVACMTGIASFLVGAGSARRYYFASVSVALLIVCQLQLGWQLGPHALVTPYAVRCVAINLATLSISLVVSTGLRVLVEKLSTVLPPLPRFIVSSIDPNGICGRCLCLSGSNLRQNSSGDARDVSTNGGYDGGDDNGTKSDSDSDIMENNPFVIDGAGTVANEWAVLAQLLDRLCFVTYVIATISYHA